MITRRIVPQQPNGELVVKATIAVPPAAEDRVSASREPKSTWSEHTCEIAKLHDVTELEAVEFVENVSIQNPGLKITGEWTGGKRTIERKEPVRRRR